MFHNIVFCIGNRTIEVNGQTFDLGVLTADTLNIPSAIYTEMRETLQRAQQKYKRYKRTKELGDWFAANEEYRDLDGMLRRYLLFHVLSDPDDIVLEETRQFTEQYALFSDNADDASLTETDHKVLTQRELYRRYMNDPEEFTEESFFVAEPPPLTRALLIFPGPIREKRKFYERYCDRFEQILDDLMSFNNTIFGFIDRSLSKLDKLSPSSYAAALNGFLYGERWYKVVANPISGTGNYTNREETRLHLVPRETAPGSGEYKIFEYYEVQYLQSFLKLDFYKALEAGFVIRRCEYCGRYFLLKDARHTKYCDQPAPDNPRYTCAQLGYRYRDIKEAAGDAPRSCSLRRCLQRIDKDCSRKIITAEEREQLYAKARGLYHQAETQPGVSFDDFEASLASKNLYPLCGIERRSRARGRPKREE